MRLITSLRLVPLKLHTKTIIIISAVLITVFVVIAYFSDLATVNLSNQQEQEQAQLLAAQVADTVGYHVKRIPRALRPTPEAILTLDWPEVQEDIKDTIIKSNPQLAQVRVFYRNDADHWEEAVKLPGNAGPASALETQAAQQQSKGVRIISLRAQGRQRMINVIAPIISPVHGGPVQIGTASVVVVFDEAQSVAAKLRRLIWPLMMLALIVIMLTTYFLFRYLVYEPIDALLLGMARAENGDLTADVHPAAPDEIGLLTSRFNRMLGRIRQMTEQLELERTNLKDRVREATSEIEGRKEQLEEANRRLFELQRQLTKLERLAAAGQLAAQFAHEVGTPLNLISGHVQVLRARAQDERAIKRLNVVAGQIKRITQIVRSLLDSTRRPALQLESLDFNALLQSIFEVAQPTLSARKVTLRTELDQELPFIEADPDQLQQVFINLINNSLDAMPEGGTLSVVTGHDDGWIVTDLADTGEGISAEQIELIFDPFFTTKQGRGTGLGMTVTRQIISEHGGIIEVESWPGKGSSFRLKLPLKADSSISELEKQHADRLVGAD